MNLTQIATTVAGHIGSSVYISITHKHYCNPDLEEGQSDVLSASIHAEHGCEYVEVPIDGEPTLSDVKSALLPSLKEINEHGCAVCGVVVNIDAILKDIESVAEHNQEGTP